MKLRKRSINRELRHQEDEDIKVKELVSKEESHSDDFQSLPLVESSDTASEMDVNEGCSHPMLCKTTCSSRKKR